MENSDESRLPPNQQLIRSDRWPIVGEKAPSDDHRPWQLVLDGLVRHSCTWTLDELRADRLIEQTVDIHCVTRWSRLGVPFEGIPLDRLLTLANLQPGAAFVSFVARSDRHHSSSLPLDEVLSAGALIALRADGRALPVEHGGPVRLVVPGKYFYKSVKWLQRIEVLAEDRLGHWEATAGYHNGADPWREQRYIAASITKQQAARFIAERDFRNEDLRGIDAAGRELSGLQAAGALLRDADFRGADLTDADFSRANLSNAHFQQADLRGAQFTGADVEGADFACADLRGADLRVASMFGASFCEIAEDGTPHQGATMDTATLISPECLAALTDDQQQYVASAAPF